MYNLDIDLYQFKKMKALDRDEIIYKNLVQIRKNFKEYKYIIQNFLYFYKFFNSSP